MPNRRRLKKEEKDELDKQKKSLKKSFQKAHSGSKRVGSKRISDTKKYSLIIGVVVIIVIIISIQFFGPPKPHYYYTEIDFVDATLDQDTQSITFNRIRAWYRLHPKYTTLNCAITDYFNTSFKIKEPDLIIPPSTVDNKIFYDFSDLASPVSWETIMENYSIPMSTWVDIIKMNTTPSSIPRVNETTVNFHLELKTNVALDSYNISLKFYQNLENTTLEAVNMIHGSHDPISFTFITQGNSLAAGSSIILKFDLNITTTNPLSELNFLAAGKVNLVKRNTLLKDYPVTSEFKESTISFVPYLVDEDEPRAYKSTLLNIVVTVPYYNITLT